MTELIQVLVSGIASGLVYGLLGLGLSLVYRTTGVINFAHGDLAIAGGYVALTLTQAHVPVWIAAIVGAIAAGLLSACIERFALNHVYGRPVIWLILITVGVSLMLESGIQLVWGSTPSSLPSILEERTWLVGGVAITRSSILILVVSLAIIAALSWFVNRTKYGRGMRACAEDSEVVTLLGIPARRLYFGAFTISGFTAGIAGVLIAPKIGLLPNSGLSLTVLGFAAAIIGGLGNFSAAVIGGVIIGVLQTGIGVYVSTSYANAVAYIVIALVLLVRVRGLFGDNLEGVRSV